MSALSDFEEAEIIALDQATECAFDPGPHFGKWLQALERSRNRVELSHGVYLQDDPSGYAGAGPANLYRRLRDEVCSDGTLVVTDEGKLQADVEVNVALIDGHFKGKITATEHVVLDNHALLIGEINTPTLTIRGGAIVEGRCYFEPSEPGEAPLERWERPGWQAFKLGFAKVWRGGLHYGAAKH